MIDAGTLSAQAAIEIDARRQELAAEITGRHFELHPSLSSRYGPAGEEKCRQDALYHLQYLAECLRAGSPRLFADYVGWARVMLAARKVPAEDLVDHLKTMSEVLAQQLEPSHREVVAAAIESAASLATSSEGTPPTFLTAVAPHAQLASEFSRALLQGRRADASRLVLDAVEGGVSVRDIYLHVFQKSQWEIGRLWQLNLISVAQEHYCTAATQMIMSQLYGRIFATERKGRTFVAACVGGEMHEIGARMVADFFEMDGWDTYYLGANTPSEGIVDTICSRGADVLGISATITYHVPTVAKLIRLVRENKQCHGTKVIVGGYPFNIDRELWRHVGADAYASDAAESIQVAERFFG